MKLAVIVPYRDRQSHLSIFLPAIEKTLKDQGIDHKIVIVEQELGKPFNRAKLLNVGYDLSKESDYFCFHDVDMIPEISDYSHCSNPTHLAAQAEQFGYKLPYEGYFGGVTLFDKESFQKVNGYANEYWGWGAEDDDIYSRCRSLGIVLSRKPCRFKSLHHQRYVNPLDYQKNLDRLGAMKAQFLKGEIFDGLSNLHYRVLSYIKNDPTYIHAVVSI